jgi:Cysteine rich repeat
MCLCIVQEVQYYQKMGIENFRNDPILADACRADVDNFCPKTQPGAQQSSRHTVA